MTQFLSAIGFRELRLIAQNSPSPEQIQNVPQGDAGTDSYRYMSDGEMQAISAAREARLAPMREQEAQSRQKDLRQLPEIEKQMQMA